MLRRERAGAVLCHHMMTICFLKYHSLAEDHWEDWGGRLGDGLLAAQNTTDDTRLRRPNTIGWTERITLTAALLKADGIIVPTTQTATYSESRAVQLFTIPQRYIL